MNESDTSHQKKTTPEETLNRSDTGIAEFEVIDKTRLDRVRRILHANPTLIPVLVLILSVGTFGLIAGRRFFHPFNLSLIIQQVSVIGILAAAQSLIILTAGIDLSVAAIMVLSTVIMGKFAVQFGFPPGLAIVVGFFLGTLCGLLNGWLVTRLRLPPFIVTLGTWNIFFALNLWFSGAQSIRSQDIDKVAPLLKFFGKRIEIFSARFTYGSILMVLIYGMIWYALNRSAWGRHVYAVGDDKDAAELSGIRTDRTLISVYALAGFICAVGAWAAIGRVGSVSPQSFYEGNLQSITAVVIGGISLFGGRGSIMGPLIGALIVGVFQSGLRLAGVDVLWQVFAIGWLIIIAVALDQWIRRASA